MQRCPLSKSLPHFGIPMTFCNSFPGIDAFSDSSQLFSCSRQGEPVIWGFSNYPGFDVGPETCSEIGGMTVIDSMPVIDSMTSSSYTFEGIMLGIINANRKAEGQYRCAGESRASSCGQEGTLVGCLLVVGKML